MPDVAADSAASASGGALVPFVPDTEIAVVYPLHHGLKPPITRVSISWARGNNLRVSLLRNPPYNSDSDGEIGGKVVEVNLDSGAADVREPVQWRRIAYGSVTPFALLQSRKNSASSLSKLQSSPSPFHLDWWEHVMEYSKDIKELLGNPKSNNDPLIEDPKEVLKKGEEPTSLKAAWELMEMFYADKLCQSWLPERLVDWLADYDCLLSGDQPTVHSKLVEFQGTLVTLQVIEDDPKYWEVISSALAIGWLEIVVKLLRLHGSYQLDQLGHRETENGLVETVAVLISMMPRFRPELKNGKLGECFEAKPDFMKAWEKWREQITKLDSSAFWVPCHHRQTREGLKNLIQIMLGNTKILCTATAHWIELYISHFLFIRPFTAGFEGMYNLAQKCVQMKPMSSPHKLLRLIIGIIGENTEVVLAECSREFGPWMVAHAIELLTARSDQADILLHKEHDDIGGISMEELHRLVYAQVLTSHFLTWQIAPVYLTSCMKQGMSLLEFLLYRQPAQHNQLLLKNLEICRLYELDHVSSNIMKIAGVYHWKHGRKGLGVFWLQQARDEFLLNKIARHLFDSVGKSISSESFKQWEGLIELLGSESKPAGSLEFLHKYRDFKKSLQQACDKKTLDAARHAADSLMSLMKNSSTPQRFWLPLLYDSLTLLTWPGRPLLNVSQTNLLLNKLQELSMASVRPGFVATDLPAEALNSVRLALATNLGRAILEEQ
ncbi:FROUNT PROTEIN-RELATED [Salix viminalis]|uniref:Nuclear pore complex protein Nup85 n=1 Tax=Salix viminalis TaxID=40686 RepID=A0A9Q0SES3_SALVM|nr:FROUNT PROTEIN-RELATED [Salix viminalis]